MNPTKIAQDLKEKIEKTPLDILESDIEQGFDSFMNQHIKPHTDDTWAYGIVCWLKEIEQIKTETQATLACFKFELKFLENAHRVDEIEDGCGWCKRTQSLQDAIKILEAKE